MSQLAPPKQDAWAFASQPPPKKKDRVTVVDPAPLARPQRRSADGAPPSGATPPAGEGPSAPDKYTSDGEGKASQRAPRRVAFNADANEKGERKRAPARVWALGVVTPSVPWYHASMWG